MFMPPGKRANDLKVTRCGIVQHFDMASSLLILGNYSWALALKPARFMGFVLNF